MSAPPVKIPNMDEIPVEVERWTTPKGRFGARLRWGWMDDMGGGPFSGRTFRNTDRRERWVERERGKLEQFIAESRAKRLGSYRLPT